MKNKYIWVAVVVIVAIAAVGGWWYLMPKPAAAPVAPASSPAAVQPVPAPSAEAPTAVQPQTAPAQAPAPAATMVVLRTDPKLGSYLADDTGRALYIFANDIAGQSACSGQCAKVWPAFYLASPKLGEGLDAGDFKVVTDASGASQTTYYGWPLYYYAGDAAAGDVKGEGFNKLWYVAKPDYTVALAHTAAGSYLVDWENARAIYRFANDAPDVSNCTGACAGNWPVFYAGKIVAPSFIDAARFGQFARPDKTAQSTFDRLPLYFFVQDKVRGDVKGQGVINAWSTVDPLAPAAH